MRINYFILLICLVLSLILSYVFHSYAPDQLSLKVAIGSFTVFFFGLAGTMALTFPYDRTTTLTRTISSLIFLPAVVLNILFINEFIHQPIYFAVTAGAISLQLLLVYSVSKSQH